MTEVVEIDLQAAEKWKIFKRAWDNYTLATELNKKDKAIQVATLPMVISEEAREVFTTFTWTTATDSAKNKPVLKSLRNIANPAKIYHLRVPVLYNRCLSLLMAVTSKRLPLIRF